MKLQALFENNGVMLDIQAALLEKFPDADVELGHFGGFRCVLITPTQKPITLAVMPTPAGLKNHRDTKSITNQPVEGRLSVWAGRGNFPLDINTPEPKSGWTSFRTHDITYNLLRTAITS